jgi:hypothetical protein
MMKPLHSLPAAILALFAMTATLIAPAHAATRILKVAGGPEGSPEQLAATGLCNFLNQEIDLTGYACETLPATEPGDGLRALRAGRVDLAFADSNHVDNPADRDKLRTVITLFPKLLAVAAHRSKALRIEDLHKNRIALGAAGDQSVELFDIAVEHRKFRSRFDITRMTLSSDNARAAALCAGEVDAAVFVASEPSVLLDDLADSCEVRMVTTCCDRSQRQMLSGSDVLMAGKITGGLYPGTRQDTATLGVRSLLVSRADLPDRAADLVVHVVADSFDRFRMLARPLFNVTPHLMASAPTPLERHPGAVRGFKSRNVR